MKEIDNVESLVCLCKALSSPVRVRIVQLLEKQGMNMNELSDCLKVTNSAMTAHIRMLEAAGVLYIENTAGKRGTQKRCHINESKFLINLLGEQQHRNTYETEIPVGSYVAYSASPTCGLATTENKIGEFDDVRFFDDPQRIFAGIVWLGAGYLEYRIPNYMRPTQRLSELHITQEISSEAPGFCEDYPSDIHFNINGRDLGAWTCPGDFGIKRGIYTPDWWTYGLNQYGLLKPLVVTRQGTYIDGIRIGTYTLDDLEISSGSEIRYRISAPDTSTHSGGLTLYGRGFGNYNHGINVRMIYEDMKHDDE